jgi:hypothetical protein
MAILAGATSRASTRRISGPVELTNTDVGDGHDTLEVPLPEVPDALLDIEAF